MKHANKRKLLGKGWNPKEIKDAEAILERFNLHDAFFSKIVFWSALMVIIFANIIVSLVLVPFLVILESWVLFSVVIVLGGMIGFFYHFLIMDIGHLERRHHILAGFLVPLLAIANMVTVVVFSNKFIAELGAQKVQHNPWVVALVFAVAFIVPSLIGYLRIHKEFKKAILE